MHHHRFRTSPTFVSRARVHSVLQSALPAIGSPPTGTVQQLRKKKYSIVEYWHRAVLISPVSTAVVVGYYWLLCPLYYRRCRHYIHYYTNL